MVTGKSGYSATKTRKLVAARTAVRKAAAALRGRTMSYSRAPPRTGGWYGTYKRGGGRTELKFIDNNVGNTAVGSTGGVALLNGVQQGTDWNQRIGRIIQMKSILFRLTLAPNIGVGQSVGDSVRILVIYDAQTNSVAPAVTDVLQVAEYDSPMNLSNRDRFKVIMDKLVAMNAFNFSGAAVVGGCPINKQINKYRKMNMEVANSGVGATVGSIGTGGLFLLLIAKENNNTLVDYYIRIRYTDN